MKIRSGFVSNSSSSSFIMVGISIDENELEKAISKVFKQVPEEGVEWDDILEEYFEGSSDAGLNLYRSDKGNECFIGSCMFDIEAYSVDELPMRLFDGQDLIDTKQDALKYLNKINLGVKEEDLKIFSVPSECLEYKMKIRTSFVSNSSSCSFVIAGVEVNQKVFDQRVIDIMLEDEQFIKAHKIDINDKETVEDMADEYKWDFIDGGHFDFEEDNGDTSGIPKDKVVIGCQLAYASCNEELEGSTISLKEVNEKVEKAIKASGLDASLDDVKIYSGTKGC